MSDTIWPPERVIEELQRHAAEGVRMTSSVMQVVDAAVRIAAYRTFGGWQLALAAAELVAPTSLVGGWRRVPAPLIEGETTISTGQRARVMLDHDGTTDSHVVLEIIDGAPQSMFAPGTLWRFARCDVRGLG